MNLLTHHLHLRRHGSWPRRRWIPVLPIKPTVVSTHKCSACVRRCTCMQTALSAFCQAADAHAGLGQHIVRRAYLIIRLACATHACVLWRQYRIATPACLAVLGPAWGPATAHHVTVITHVTSTSLAVEYCAAVDAVYVCLLHVPPGRRGRSRRLRCHASDAPEAVPGGL